jgi:hypothetical protein
MARINQPLLQATVAKSGLSQARVYAKIAQTARDELLPKHAAAILVARDVGVNVQRFATPEELAFVRNGRPAVNDAPREEPSPRAPVASTRSRTARTPKPKKPPNDRAVFVVHGRDDVLRNDMFQLLRALDLDPLEWTRAIAMTKKASPYVKEVLDAAFSYAKAVVILMTPDDEVQLRPDLLKKSDDASERKPSRQARPNVLFEAGLAFATHERHTIIVEVGKVRQFTDIGGIHTVRLTGGSPHALTLFANRLETAGCRTNRLNTDWLSAGRFQDPIKRAKTKR